MSVYQKIEEAINIINKIKKVRNSISNLESIYTLDTIEYIISFKENSIIYKLNVNKEINSLISNIMLEWLNRKLEENKEEIRKYIVDELDKFVSNFKEQINNG